MVFGVSRPKRLSVVDVEELGKARQELDRRGIVGFGDGVRRRAHPLSETGERALYAVRDGVGRELRHFAKPLSKVRQMFREDFALDAAAYPGVATLDMLAKRGRGVKIELVTHSNGELEESDFEAFGAQCGKFTKTICGICHDRFIIVDQKEIFWKMRRRNACAFRRGDSAKAEPEGRTSVRSASGSGLSPHRRVRKRV